MSATYYFIQNKLQSVFNDFKDEEWCDLDISNFNAKGYSVKAHQKAYILKYYAAYFCELYRAYGRFIDNFSGNNLNVLSIGCGSGVDCEALYRVNIDRGRGLNINYVGVDIVDWDYRPNFHWASFQNKCASSISKSDVCDVDLYVFPKSLTELSIEAREHIANTIIENSQKDKIYFVNTYVTNNPNYSNYVNGLSQFRTINNKLTKSSWCYLSDPNLYWYLKNTGWLGNTFDFFSIPNDITPFVRELKSNCSNQVDDEKCRECEVGFLPIFNGNYLAYGVIDYEKRVI